MSAQNKRSTMTLYASGADPFCHRIKIILAEKDITADIIDIDEEDKLEELYELNPYGKVPTLMTKDLIVYEPDIIFEYLEERFPYPPLLSVFPLERATARMLSKKIDAEWIPLLISALNTEDEEQKQLDKIELLKALFSLLPTLKRQPYLLGEDFSIVDCSMAVILYNLPKLDIKLPEKAMPLIKYATRIFNRPSFRKSIKM
ncbi:glutathione S-transferase N-terminal domain-containing protein [Fangia hongkongensis]|uniref:glutathione S-transferase N-terminal domain-containing protein n=1 Tax=Fangia hongkongensis TaxID=270495 RepID=UPI00036310BA|nr:glutathione S-transferase N-terminal domain-containing protein [Fangia hongkongensis]MBK2125075.1 glutathione S-transferase N-terminal domain-containing protein [Fangia hongkongensis]